MSSSFSVALSAYYASKSVDKNLFSKNLEIVKEDWKARSQKSKDKGVLLSEFVHKFLIDLCSKEYASCPNQRMFIRYASDQCSFICSKWLYNGIWKVKGDPLRYFIAQFMGKSGHEDCLVGMYEYFDWDLDESLNPDKYISASQTIEVSIVPAPNDPNISIEFDLAFYADTLIKLGSKWNGNEVQYYDCATMLYDVETRVGNHYWATEQQLRKWMATGKMPKGLEQI